MTTPTYAREQARHNASVMIAFAEGKEIQFKGRNEPEGWETVPDPTWQFDFYDYRVKPEERKPLTGHMWMHPEYPGLHRCHGCKDDNTATHDLGWVLVPVVEVLSSENTGGQQ